MTSSQLPNYLRANRKRLALSQDEVAFLLGVQSGAKISRYERFARVPSLETALAFEAIYKIPARELFAGLSEKVAQEISARAKTLVSRENRDKPTRQTARKREMLSNIAAPQFNQPLNLHEQN